jgi:hypothetical protein
MGIFANEVINIALGNMPQVYMNWINIIYISLVDRDTVSIRSIHLEENHPRFFSTAHRSNAIVVICIDHIDIDDKCSYQFLNLDSSN